MIMIWELSCSIYNKLNQNYRMGLITCHRQAQTLKVAIITDTPRVIDYYQI